MNWRNLIREWRAEINVACIDLSHAFALRAGIDSSAAATPHPASVEEVVRSGAVVPEASPYLGEDPRRSVPRNLPQVRHLLELIAGEKCTKVISQSRCWEDASLAPNCEWWADRWCDACIAQAALDALESPNPSPRSDIAPRGESAGPGPSPTGGDVCGSGPASNVPS